ncbi:MAG TPA: hypothetical protein VKB38_03685 [Terracidiphilus sp.]|nr:hypothetical protein [Terracidiphilus sp.]
MKLNIMCLLAFMAVVPLCAQTADRLDAHGTSVANTTYQGKIAVRVDALPDAANGESYAIVKASRFHNGTIDVDVAGKPAANANAGARGFIGIAFRMQGDHYEYIYLRPTNGRADDQVRRNHSTQYAAQPDYDYDRLRKESPGKYESYVDLEPGVWTHFRIVIEGTRARLYVHDATQPCLIVDDLKLGDSEGLVALWVGPGTEGYFANLKIAQ